MLLLAAIVSLTNRFGSVSVDTFGARIVSYRPTGGEEVLAKLSDGSGGIQLCWPWFANAGPEGCRRHGVARYHEFVVVGAQGEDELRLELVSDAETRKAFPHDFRLTLAIRLAECLKLELVSENTGKDDFAASEMIHPYFRVADARSCVVRGLDNCRYLDNMQPALGDTRVWRGDYTVTEGSKVFELAPTDANLISLEDPIGGRAFYFRLENSVKAVVWSPGEQTERSALVTSQLAPGEWRKFVCVENGTCYKDRAYVLKPGERHVLRRTIAVASDRSIQARIDAASAAGGGEVVVAAGEYENVKPLVLKSNVTLNLQPGAVIHAVTNYADYAFMPGQNRGAFISAIGATNVAIVGGGRVECSGDRMPKVTKTPGRWRGIHLYRCHGVRFENVTFANAHSWCCYLQECEDVLVRKVMIRNHANFNNDGLDLEVRNALIEDCDIDTDDDSIVLKNHNRGFVVENVEVRRCRVGGNTNSLKIGTETFGDFRNIWFHDCIVSPRRNSAVWPLSNEVPGLDKTVASGKGGIVLATVDGGSIENVRVNDIVIDGVETPIYVRLGRRRCGELRSEMRNVVIENVKARAVSRIACSVTGVPGEPKRRPVDITLRNITLDVPGGTAGDERLKEPVPECEKGYPSPRNFRFHPLPACGVYVRHADGVKLENVTVTRRAPDCRPDVVREDSPCP